MMTSSSSKTTPSASPAERNAIGSGTQHTGDFPGVVNIQAKTERVIPRLPPQASLNSCMPFPQAIEESPITPLYCLPTKGARSMAVRAQIDPAEAADRLAIRELFDAYAHCADRRDIDGQKALFTVDTRFAVLMDGDGTEPTYVLEGRESLTPVFADLNRYEATTHFNGQSTIDLTGDHASGESYTIAHHLFTDDGERKIMVASLRYLDRFVKLEGAWYFEERKLILDWSETRPSAP